MYGDGDLVWVEDPALGWTPGQVMVSYADGDLLVEGPNVPGESRTIAWTIMASSVPAMVSPRHESVNGMEDRLAGLLNAMTASLKAGNSAAAITLAERAEGLAAVIDRKRVEMGHWPSP